MQRLELTTQAAGVWQVEHLRAAEQKAIAAGVDEWQLVQRAAKAACCALRQRYAQAEHVAVLCGVGNNGADGYALAALLQQAGLKPQIHALWGAPKTEVARRASAVCEQLGVPQHEAGVLPAVGETQLLVDGLLGIGLSRPLQGQMLQHIRQINLLRLPVLALDITSGLQADTGCALPEAIVADSTVSFLGLKRGFFMQDGPHVAGHLMLHDLDVGADLLPCCDAVLFHVQQLQAPLLQRRQVDAHKGCFGHCLVVAGAQGMPGAGVLATHAALRTGAGLVRVATHGHHTAAGAMRHPEAVWQAVQQGDNLCDLLAKATCVVVGPGLGQDAWGQQLWAVVAQRPNIPMVVDADALGLLAKSPSRYERWILTPHPKEAAQLLGCSTQQVQQDRFAAARAVQARYGGVVVLKGAYTVVASNAPAVQVCPAGNPGMASAGMGDVLSGILGGLLAQFGSSVDLQQLAALGVWLHAQAGDKAAAQQGQRGLLAGDVIAQLPALVNPA